MAFDTGPINQGPCRTLGACLSSTISPLAMRFHLRHTCAPLERAGRALVKCLWAEAAALYGIGTTPWRGLKRSCARSVTIWASGRTTNPHFVILGASLLFDSRFCCFFHIGDMAFPPSCSHFHLFSRISCSFPPHPLLSRLISPHHRVCSHIDTYSAGPFTAHQTRIL